jgi:transglutaminase-like putative cysteine protease
MRLRHTGAQQRVIPTWLVGWLLTALAAWETQRVYNVEYSPLALTAATLVVSLVALLTWRFVWPIRLASLALATVVLSAAVTIIDGRPRGFDLVDAMINAPIRGFGQLAAAVWPSPALPTGVAALAMLVVGAAALTADLSLRRRIGASLFPPTLALGAVALLSADGGPPATWVIVAFVLLVFALLRVGQPSTHSNVSRAITIGMVVLVAAVPVVGANWFDGDRYDPRDQIQGREPTDVGVSPFGRVSQWRSLQDNPTMFRSNLSEPARWRLVVLTRFDGRDWRPASDYRVASRLLRDTDPSLPVTDIDVTLLGLDAPWLPSVDGTIRVSRSVEVDADASSLLIERTDPITVAPGLAATDISGERYQLGAQAVARTADELAGAQAAAVTDPVFIDAFQPSNEIVQLAESAVAGAATDAQRAESLATFLRESYVLNSDVATGHSIATIDAFLRSTRRGADEQFVAGYAVMAAAIGLPVRVSIGFDTVADGSSAEPATVAFAQSAVAWPEVHFEGLGWVPFDPVPTEENKAPSRQPIGATGPAVILDSPAPPASLPADVQDSEVVETPPASETVVDDADAQSALPLVLAIAVLAALLIGAIVYVVVVVTLKHRRRQKRRELVDPRQRILGAFRSGMDTLVDHGVELSAAHTDREAVELATPGLRSAARHLQPAAMVATAAVYSSELVLDDGHADDVWDDVDQFTRAAGADVGRRRALRALLSTRSLRRKLPS